MNVIEKRALRPEGYRRLSEPFPRARDAFQALLVRAGVPASGTVLLPAYIGWSRREGSGVFDPLLALGARCAFYRVTRSLRIDLTDLAEQIVRYRPRVLMLIHYFGRPDPSLDDAVALGRKAGALVVEDEAHALFSDLVGGVCGRHGDAAIFSLHKMLPVDSGGLLVHNCERWSLAHLAPQRLTHGGAPLVQYDLCSIAKRRVENSLALEGLLAPLSDLLEPLWPELPEGVIPQTYPVILHEAPRDEVYERMNRAGFGVVSLYHTMVSAIAADAYPDSHWLARRILNLPVHQDTTPESLAVMTRELAHVLGAGT